MKYIEISNIIDNNLLFKNPKPFLISEIGLQEKGYLFKPPASTGVNT